jgi:hypothetical protein
MSIYTDYEADNAQADIELLNQLMQIDSDMQNAIDTTIKSLDKFNWSIGLTEQDVREFFSEYDEEDFSSDLMMDLLWGRAATQEEIVQDANMDAYLGYVNDNRTY